MNDFQDRPFRESSVAQLAPASPDPTERPAFRVTCAWCGTVIEEGPGPVSHGMCAACRSSFLAMMPGA